MSCIPTLIEIYAAHTINEVRDHAALIEEPFQKTLQELCALAGFSDDQDFVRGLKDSIEQGKARFETQDKPVQVVECLKALLVIVARGTPPAEQVKRRFDTLRRLFTLMYAGGWNDTLSAHFNFVADLLRESHTYFLSYTNNGATVINDDFAGVIRKFADPDVRRKRKRDQDNMLPDAIVNQLDRNNLGRLSFYDKRSIEAGDFIKETVAPGIRRGLVFIQLVHLDTFTAAKKVNWPFEEYKIFREANTEFCEKQKRYEGALESRLIPLIAGDPRKLNLSDDKLPDEKYRPWRDRLFDETLHIRLTADKHDFEARMEQLENAVIRRVHRLIESVPS